MRVLAFTLVLAALVGVSFAGGWLARGSTSETCYVQSPRSSSQSMLRGNHSLLRSGASRVVCR